jgi:hypothetical protein
MSANFRSLQITSANFQHAKVNKYNNKQGNQVLIFFKGAQRKSSFFANNSGYIFLGAKFAKNPQNS